MWDELKNKTDFLRRDGNESLRVLSEQPLVSVTSTQSNGNTTTTLHPPGTEAPLDRGSGIIPGGIAAAVFISFLLALYAVLWKCMVTPPKRSTGRGKKKKKKRRVSEPRDQVC
ncbi:hypothetical protein AGOR_G00054620 [Albula goreensis]|uniref:Uncharacterized protein n=1 Tax=Albula goreensis TaxID=1534307 RepID=A0A8T3DVF4_9TELE|nr:hypothetical protein AGOR_G00054620 [Albula goreensis]